MFEVDVNGLTQQYRSKPIMNVDITGSSGDSAGSSGGGGDSMKNLNVVAFSGGHSGGMPESCNVTYDELRGWIENGTPVIAVWNTNKYNTDEKMVEFLTGIEVGSSALDVYYQDYNLGKQNFQYKSDGSFEPVIST